MPKLSVWFIRSALLYLAAGFTIGMILLINKAIPFFPIAWNFLPVHIECVMTGFILQLTMGTAFWIFPRLLTFSDRGNETLMVLSFLFLNAGIFIFCVFVFIFPQLQLLGRLFESLGVVFFVLHLWPRIYPFGKY
jgi:hypothetical protein